MIITVTRIVIIGEKRIEKTATAQINHGLTAHISRVLNSGAAGIVYCGDEITETARSLFASLDPVDSQTPTSAP